MREDSLTCCAVCGYKIMPVGDAVSVPCFPKTNEQGDRVFVENAILCMKCAKKLKPAIDYRGYDLPDGWE